MSLGLYEERPVRRIDYDLMSREYPKVNAALTRARNSGDPISVREAVARFVRLSHDCGAMPDNWAIFRNALEDAFDAWRRTEAADADHFDHGDQELEKWRQVGRHFDF